MFVTLRARPTKSVTGTNPAYGLRPAGSTRPAPDQPYQPRPYNVPFADQRRGPYGGLYYNCSPRDKVGSLVSGLPSSYREVQRAEPSRLDPVLGVIVSKAEPTVCEVLHAGPISAFADLEQGVRYYLGLMGTLRAPPLDSDPQLGYIHYIGMALDDQTLLVQPSYPLLKRSL